MSVNYPTNNIFQLLKLVQEVLHASACALYELLNCVNELTWACGTQAGAQENVPSLTAFLQVGKQYISVIY